MDLALSAEQEELRTRARALADAIKEHELDCEEQNGLGPEAHVADDDRVGVDVGRGVDLRLAVAEGVDRHAGPQVE